MQAGIHNLTSLLPLQGSSGCGLEALSQMEQARHSLSPRLHEAMPSSNAVMLACGAAPPAGEHGGGMEALNSMDQASFLLEGNSMFR